MSCSLLRFASLFIFTMQYPTISHAACIAPGTQNQISSEAERIISEGELRKVEASSEIDRETAQRLLGRLFDLKSGKDRSLSPSTEAQYRRDAKYFSEKLRKESAEQRAASEAILALIVPCPINPAAKIK